jgi:hypothetical protein
MPSTYHRRKSTAAERLQGEASACNYLLTAVQAWLSLSNTETCSSITPKVNDMQDFKKIKLELQ